MPRRWCAKCGVLLLRWVTPTDDHLPVNRAGVPCIDIIDMRMDSQYGFFSGWHTSDDVMRHISPATLGAVGETLLTLIYSY